MGLAESKTTQVKRAFQTRRAGGARPIAPPKSISQQAPHLAAGNAFDVKRAFQTRRRGGARPIAPPKSISTTQAHLGITSTNFAVAADARATPAGLRQIMPPMSMNFGGSAGETHAFAIERPNPASPGRRTISPPKSISEQPAILNVGSSSLMASSPSKGSVIGMGRGLTPAAGAAPAANLFGPVSTSSPMMVSSPDKEPAAAYDGSSQYRGDGPLAAVSPSKSVDGYAQRGIVMAGVASNYKPTADGYMDQHVKAQAALAYHRPRSPRQSNFSLDKVEQVAKAEEALAPAPAAALRAAAPPAAAPPVVDLSGETAS